VPGITRPPRSGASTPAPSLVDLIGPASTVSSHPAQRRLHHHRVSRVSAPDSVASKHDHLVVSACVLPAEGIAEAEQPVLVLDRLLGMSPCTISSILVQASFIISAATLVAVSARRRGPWRSGHRRRYGWCCR
jgi:hypothetical protein